MHIQDDGQLWSFSVLFPHTHFDFSLSHENLTHCMIRGQFLIAVSPLVLPFGTVPRAHFVPPAAVATAYNDAPLRSGPVHLSAPHIYGAVVSLKEMSKYLSF